MLDRRRDEDHAGGDRKVKRPPGSVQAGPRKAEATPSTGRT